MLKHLAIFAVLATLWSSPPIPGQTANHRGNGTQQPKYQAQASQNPSTPALAAAVPKNSNSEQLKNDPKREPSENKESTIAISKLPTTNVTIERNAKRDIFDWIAYGGNLLLVAVGLLGVVVGGYTLGWLRIQTNAAKDAATAALSQIQMMKDKERAELRIIFSEPSTVFDAEKGGYPIHYSITLYGTTRAHIIQNSALAYFSMQAREHKKISFYLPAPEYFTPEMGSFNDYIVLRKSEGWPPDVQEDIGRLDLNQIPYPNIFIDGKIIYRDVFGEIWNLEFDREWIPNVRIFPSQTGGMWAPRSSGEHDRLRKVEHAKQKEPENPA